jgi:RsiW-degrading membrane proteinase PrsW (M82 family)
MNWNSSISIAALGGILPALFWLWYWLHEDNLHPEPRRRVLACFLAGMLAVPLVFPFQKVVHDYFNNDSTIVFFLWAVIEEVFKFGAAFVFAISQKDNDEPIDVVLYMITAALGFSALENTFFLLSSLQTSTFDVTFITGNLRFIGATLLHTVASASVGIFIAFSYFKRTIERRILTIIGLIVAIVLHTLFNLSIINTDGTKTVIAFYSVWIGIIVVLLMFEKVKKITNPFLNSF